MILSNSEIGLTKQILARYRHQFMTNVYCKLFLTLKPQLDKVNSHYSMQSCLHCKLHDITFVEHLLLDTYLSTWWIRTSSYKANETWELNELNYGAFSRIDMWSSPGFPNPDQFACSRNVFIISSFCSSQPDKPDASKGSEEASVAGGDRGARVASRRRSVSGHEVQHPIGVSQELVRRRTQQHHPTHGAGRHRG